MSNYKRTNNHKKSNKSGIYCITNKINNKNYIGQTYDLRYRWSRHKSDLNNNRHSNNHLQSAWNKYGAENFEYSILEYCDLSVIDTREIYWINYYDSIKTGYNQCEGGLGCRGYKHTEEELKKMRQVQKPKSVLQYDSTGKFIKRWDSASQAAKELGLFTLTIKNCCEKVGFVKSSGGFIWIYEEDKDTVDMSYYLIKKSPCKKIGQYDKDMVLIKIWDSMTQAAQELNYSYSSITKAKKSGKMYKGFIWKLV